MSERRFVPESVVRGGVVGAVASQRIDLPVPEPQRPRITSSDQLTIFDAGKARRAREERGES